MQRLIRFSVSGLFGISELSGKAIPMRLNLALNGILVASAPVDPSRCKDEFYLQALRKQILQQNSEVLNLIPAKPLFYIEVPASAAYLRRNEKGFGA